MCYVHNQWYDISRATRYHHYHSHHRQNKFKLMVSFENKFGNSFHCTTTAQYRLQGLRWISLQPCRNNPTTDFLCSWKHDNVAYGYLTNSKDDDVDDNDDYDDHDDKCVYCTLWNYQFWYLLRNSGSSNLEIGNLDLCKLRVYNLIF